MSYVIPSWEPPSIAVAGTSARFPVRRIWCVGRNYAAHAREMGSDPTREPPFFFAKPADAVVDDRSTVPYPPLTTNYHHEIELVVAIGRPGRAIAVEKALEHVWGYAAGLDMTRRDLQNAAKKIGQPWESGKAFDHAAPVGALVPASRIGHPARGTIALRVDGETRQKADLSDMIWNVAGVIAQLSQLVALAPGDIVFTGTPEGVGPVVAGQRLDGEIEGVGTISITIGA